MTLVLIFVSIAMLAGGAALYAVLRYWSGNLHAVLPGQLYRSAQPGVAQLERWHGRIGFKTILNLRGAHPKWEIYRTEKAFAEEKGLTLIDYKIKASRRLTEPQIQQLLEIFESAEKPILVHCKSGADRSGLVAGLFAMRSGRSTWFSLWQFSPWYGHFPLPFMGAYAMDETFAAHRARLRHQNAEPVMERAGEV